jgi:hypothetical protein
MADVDASASATVSVEVTSAPHTPQRPDAETLSLPQRGQPIYLPVGKAIMQRNLVNSNQRGHFANGWIDGAHRRTQGQ